MKQITVKLTPEQISTITSALNADYYKTLKCIENSDSDTVKRFWAAQFRQITDVINTLFDQTYSR